ncbi:MAG: hypothetical protein KKH72_09020 [Alphaproteobacteria bacterium]|nr:hypothetical protein [Alphaproteobacteria bacterium]
MRFVLDVIRAFFRIVALMLMLTAFFAIGLLFNALLSGYEKLSFPLGRVWFEDDVLRPILGSPSIQLFQVFFERKLAMPFLWDPVITTILNWPTWLALGGGAVFCVIGAMLIFGFTKRREEPKPPVYV